MTQILHTARGPLTLPAFLPVTTFGGRFPLDELIRPYLRRLSPALMVSYHYAKQIKRRTKEILFIDSGGFASLFEGAEYFEREDYAVIRTREGDEISPPEVLALQEKYADIAATVDFIIPPDCPPEEAERRQRLTERNAIWALRHRRADQLRLFASVQAWDAESATATMRKLVGEPFDGFALGGMVPRAKRPNEILTIVRAIRGVDRKRPLHVFGIGNAELIRAVFNEGATSVDSSSWVRAAVDGRHIDRKTGATAELITDEPSGCDCQSCARLGTTYLSLEGEANRMALSLHNLHSLHAAVRF
jgi:helicase